jgi:hypothetical protein
MADNNAPAEGTGRGRRAASPRRRESAAERRQRELREREEAERLAREVGLERGAERELGAELTAEQRRERELADQLTAEQRRERELRSSLVLNSPQRTIGQLDEILGNVHDTDIVDTTTRLVASAQQRLLARAITPTHGDPGVLHDNAPVRN